MALAAALFFLFLAAAASLAAAGTAAPAGVAAAASSALASAHFLITVSAHSYHRLHYAAGI